MRALWRVTGAATPIRASICPQWRAVRGAGRFAPGAAQIRFERPTCSVTAKAPRAPLSCAALKGRAMPRARLLRPLSEALSGSQAHCRCCLIGAVCVRARGGATQFVDSPLSVSRLLSAQLGNHTEHSPHFRRSKVSSRRVAGRHVALKAFGHIPPFIGKTLRSSPW